MSDTWWGVRLSAKDHPIWRIVERLVMICGIGIVLSHVGGLDLTADGTEALGGAWLLRELLNLRKMDRS